MLDVWILKECPAYRNEGVPPDVPADTKNDHLRFSIQWVVKTASPAMLSLNFDTVRPDVGIP